MQDIQIYLSGGMSDLSYEEYTKWRNQIRNEILYGDNDKTKNPVFFNPPDYYDFEEISHKSEREIFEFDLNGLRKSDLVIVNFNDPKSLGTMAELILAKEYNIPVIGLNQDNKKQLHPWLEECVTRMCFSLREVADHVVKYYLN